MEYIGFQWAYFIGMIIVLYLTHLHFKEKDREALREIDRDYEKQKTDRVESDRRDYVYKICKSFLIHAKVYQNFEQNFYKHREIEYNIYNNPVFKAYCNDTPHEDFIKNAFDWDDSREGVNVWTALDAYWQTVPKDKPFTYEVSDAIGANFKVKWYRH